MKQSSRMTTRYMINTDKDNRLKMEKKKKKSSQSQFNEKRQTETCRKDMTSFHTTSIFRELIWWKSISSECQGIGNDYSLFDL